MKLELSYKTKGIIESIIYLISLLIVLILTKILLTYHIINQETWQNITVGITLLVFSFWLAKIIIYNNPLTSYRKKVPFLHTKDDMADSQGEAKIAYYLQSIGVIFESHKKIIVRDKKLIFLTSLITIEPDFYLPNEKIFIEFYGMANKNSFEDMKARSKTKLYHDNQLQIISLYPRHLSNLDFYLGKQIEKKKELKKLSNY